MTNKKPVSDKLFDLVVIGGGINGTAIAADAAGRGLNVLLCEKNDLAAGTSSASTKLIHGGLRYLELYEFNVVRKALKEREILLRRSPNLIQPLEFILPHDQHLRPAWMIRLGLFFYDHLSKRNFLPSSHQIDFTQDKRGEALQKRFKIGFSYYDCFTEDSRLVILNALSFHENKGIILTRTEFISAHQEKDRWRVLIKNQLSGQEYSITTKGLINAAGPWVSSVQERIQGVNHHLNIKLDKGSHLILPKLYEGNFAYILQNRDKRIVFTIPYQQDFTLLGTTDIPYHQNPDTVHISDEEVNYLCEIIHSHFKKTISPKDIIYTYSGVRCLQNEPHTRVSQTTRDYKLLLEGQSNPFLLTVIGGKLTTHRMLAEEAVDSLKPFFPYMGASWTAASILPGCHFDNQSFFDFCNKLVTEFPALPKNLLTRLANNYGTFSYEILRNVQIQQDLGECFSKDLYEREVRYLIQKEWAKTAEDILWRRTKLGLTITKEEHNKLTDWLSKSSLVIF